MPQMTVEERELLTSHLVKTRDLLLAEVRDVRPDQWNFRPDEETWSVGECCDHILTIERRIFTMVAKVMPAAAANPERGAEVQHKTAKMLRWGSDRGTRIKVPEGIHNHSQSASAEEFVGPFEERRAKVLEYVAKTEDPMHDRVMPHPMFNDLDGYQWLWMISLHSERHAAQIVEVKGGVRYPAF